ncbi:MAG: cytochrome c3 family protein [Desulfovibrionaceae bacterium]|nr:cytochrome c3 family protein [Desulfovibrionaceae bacterium]
MKKSLLISLMVAALVCVFALPTVFAGPAAPDVITMSVPEGVKATKTPVTLSHKKHEAEYGIDCLVCHHKATSKDDIKGCASEGCHTDASKAAKKDPKGFYKAFHAKADASCLGCHKKEKKAGKAAPVSCKDCHPKK